MVTATQTPLRRIDWRFLLPRPFGPFEHMVLLGGNEGIVDRIKEVGLARRVSCELPDKRTADLIVLLTGARVDVDAAVSCLLPAGLLYWEVDRRAPAHLAQTPTRIAHRLRALGFGDVNIYAARPSFEACQFYFPMDAPHSFKWFMDTLFVAQSPLRRMVEHTVGRAVTVHRALYSQLLPYLSVVGTCEEQGGNNECFLDDSIVSDNLRSAQVSTLIFTYGDNRLAMFPFRSDGKGPEVVKKVPKLPAFNVKNLREQETLESIRAQVSSTLRCTIPRPMGLFECGDVAIGVESYVEGQSLLRSSARWGVPISKKIEDLELAADWLTLFHSETARRRGPWGADQMTTWIEEPIHTYKDRFGASEAEETLFERIRRQALSLQGAPFALVWQHRDFNIWNVFRNGETVSVIDWEGGRLGPPLCDLLHFATHWNEVVRSLQSEEDRLSAFQRLYVAPVKSDAIISAVYRAIGRYMQQLDLNHRFFPLLLSCTWIELANSRFEQQATHGEVGRNARLNNRQIAYVNVLAQEAERLFSES